MGIRDLLGHIKGTDVYEEGVHLSKLMSKGILRVGIDGDCWLHRALHAAIPHMMFGHSLNYGKASDLEMGYNAYVSCIMKMITDFTDMQLEVVIVFDGHSLPIKHQAIRERHDKKTKSREELEKHSNEAEQLLAEAEAVMNSARQCEPNSDASILLYKEYQDLQDRAYMASSAARRKRAACTGVSPELRHIIFETLRNLHMDNVEFIVAPYEADAQLAYLIQEDIIQAVETTDSDSLVFGCKHVIFDLNKTGPKMCSLVTLDNVLGLPVFSGWSFDAFRLYCLLLGCDYVQRFPGFGPKKAYAIMTGTWDTRPHPRPENLEEVICALEKRKFSFKKESERMSPEYYQALQKAWLTFQHQWVWDPRSTQLVPLTPRPTDVREVRRSHPSRSGGDADGNGNATPQPFDWSFLGIHEKDAAHVKWHESIHGLGGGSQVEALRAIRWEPCPTGRRQGRIVCTSTSTSTRSSSSRSNESGAMVPSRVVGHTDDKTMKPSGKRSASSPSQGNQPLKLTLMDGTADGKENVHTACSQNAGGGTAAAAPARAPKVARKACAPCPSDGASASVPGDTRRASWVPQRMLDVPETAPGKAKKTMRAVNTPQVR